MFEHKGQPLASRSVYYGRLARYAAVAFSIIGGSLAVGVLGYHYI